MNKLEKNTPKKEDNLKEALKDFSCKLAKNIRTVPFDFYKNVSERPWDFI